MITFEEALENVLKHTSVLGIEKVLIEKSVGMVLAEDIYSKIEMPPFDKSAVDGYALRACDIKTIPATLKNLGNIKAGQGFNKKINHGECLKIMTGAPLPEGADSVVMVEFTEEVTSHQSPVTSKKEFIKILQRVGKGGNVCFRAEDLKYGQKVLAKGVEIEVAHVPVLAAVGRKFVQVVAQPKAAILNTGGEIVPVGRKLPKNSIYNTNGPMFQALFNSDGIEAAVLGIAADDKRELAEKIKKGLNSDILLISGGVSVGDYDFVPQVLQELGVKQVFHKVKIKPGKPLFFGVKNRTIILGVPGNPLAGFLAYLVFARPALLKMKGNKSYYPVFKGGILKSSFLKQCGRKHFALVNITKKQNQYYLSPISSHGSADIFSLSKAQGFMMVEAGKCLKKGERVKFITI